MILFIKKYALLLKGAGIALLMGAVAYFKNAAAQAEKREAERQAFAAQERERMLREAQEQAEGAREAGDELIREADKDDPTDSDWNNRFKS